MYCSFWSCVYLGVTSKPTATDVLDIKNKNHKQKLPKFADKDFN